MRDLLLVKLCNFLPIFGFLPYICTKSLTRHFGVLTFHPVPYLKRKGTIFYVLSAIKKMGYT